MSTESVKNEARLRAQVALTAYALVVPGCNGMIEINQATVVGLLKDLDVWIDANHIDSVEAKNQVALTKGLAE